MKLYILSTNEVDFLTCFSHESILFDNQPPFSVGDYLLFQNNGLVSGVASIHAIVDFEEKRKCHLSFDYAFLSEQRLSLDETMVSEVMKRDEATNLSYIDAVDIPSFLTELNETDNHLGLFFTNIDYFLEQAAEKQAVETNKQIRQKNRLSASHKADAKIGDHQKAQYLLNEIANICNLQTWTASNDKNRLIGQLKLGATDIASFPLLETSSDSQRTIELIDTIWLKENRPVCAFETETSTPIFSGLLRMADLATILSTVNLNLYIVAPKARAKKFLKEINRPLFRQIQLEKHCHFIPLESLEILYQKIKGLDGYVDFEVINVIRQSSKQLEKLHL